MDALDQMLDPDYLSHLKMAEQDNLEEAKARVAKITSNLEKLDLLLSMTSTGFASTPTPIATSFPELFTKAPRVKVTPGPKRDAVKMPKAMGPIEIPPVKRGVGRPASPDKPITIGAYLLAKGLDQSTVGKIKGSFGTRLKAYAKRAGREINYEWVKGQKYGGDGSPEELRRIAWKEQDRDLLDYVFDLHYSHMVRTSV